MPVTLVKGKELVSGLENFVPGIAQKEAITFPVSENMCIGYFKVSAGTPELKMDTPFEEVDYITEGAATISDEAGNTHTAQKGDIVFLRKGSKVTITYKQDVGFEGIYITYPYNWKELLQELESRG